MLSLEKKANSEFWKSTLQDKAFFYELSSALIAYTYHVEIGQSHQRYNTTTQKC